MSEKQVGALVGAAAVAAMLLLFLHCDVDEAINYVVGEDKRNNWAIITPPYYYPPNGTTLRIGDTLQFKYNKWAHNVVGVGPDGYRKCDGSQPYTSGNDKITLKKGWNYFICTKVKKATQKNLCNDFGMKIAVKAI